MPIAASRSITCTFGKALRTACTQREHVVVPDGEPLALNELDDGAVLEIDRRESACGPSHITNTDTSGVSQPHRDAVLPQVLLERLHAGFGVVKDRRGERGVGRARA